MNPNDEELIGSVRAIYGFLVAHGMTAYTARIEALVRRFREVNAELSNVKKSLEIEQNGW